MVRGASHRGRPGATPNPVNKPILGCRDDGGSAPDLAHRSKVAYTLKAPPSLEP